MSRNKKRDEEQLVAFKHEALEALNEIEIALVSLNLGRKHNENLEVVSRFMHAIHSGAKLNQMDDLCTHLNDMFAILLKMNEEKAHRSDGIYYLIGGCREIRNYFNGKAIKFKAGRSLSKVGNAIDKGILDTYKEIFARRRDLTAHKGNIMVIDDDIDMAELIKHQLEGFGFSVDVFESGEKLLQQASLQAPDLIISDYNMPKANGIDLMRMIHRINDEIPVIFFSAFLTKDIVLEALNSGALGFLEKPVDEVQLILMVEAAVARARSTHLINRSINFLKYHFFELNETLTKQGKAALMNSIRVELEDISKQQRRLRKNRTKSENVKVKKSA